MNLTGKIALITGAGVGIGKEIALQFAKAGAKVAINYNNSSQGAEDAVATIREQGGTAEAFKADVTQVDQINSLVQDVEAKLGGKIDILVNNAGGLIERRSIEEMTEEVYAKIMDVNFKSTVFMCKAIIPSMKANNGGAIINLTSLAAHDGGGRGAAVYAASKGAAMSLTKGLAKELAPHGIRVNAVSPGFIANTPFHNTFTPVETQKAIISGIPLGREGRPSDVAGAVLYLASEHSAFLTGETIEVNGGVFMR